MKRVFPLILGFLFIINSLSAEVVAGIDLETLKRPDGLTLSPNELKEERTEQARIRKALKLIRVGEKNANAKDGYSKFDKKKIDRSNLRKSGRESIEEGEELLQLGADNLLALYERCRNRHEVLSEAEESGLLHLWTNKEGRSIQALFVELLGEQLKIKTTQGIDYVIPLDTLIERDQAAARLMQTGVQLNATDFINTAASGETYEIDRFYDAGYEPDSETQGDALTAAIERSQSLSPMLEKLLSHGISPNTTNSEGLLPLSICAQEGAQQAAKYLIKAGARVNANDATEEEFTPVLWAIHLGDSLMTTLLAKDIYDLSPHMKALVQLAEDDQLQPVSLELLQQLHDIENGAKLNFQDEVEFELELFGLEKTMAALEKAILTRSLRPYITNYHSFDFYVYTLERNNEYIEDVINVWKDQRVKGSLAANYSLAIALLKNWMGYQDPEGAIRYLKEAAAEEHPPSMILLGEIYEEGRFVEADALKAFNNYRRAAEIEYPLGMVKLGHCYEKGIHTERDLEKAFNWYKRATEAGSTEGMAELGRCYMDGINVKADTNEGIEWYTKAAEANNLTAMNYLGEALLTGRSRRGSSSKGVQWLQRAADFGDPAALLKLGYAYSDGTLREDQQAASKYFLEAAERDNVEAMYQIGRRFSTGKGIQKDHKAAFSWYEKAADSGHLDALNQVGVAYSSGAGVTKNETKAFSIFKEVAAQGQMEAKANLAVCYGKGLGTTVNEQESSRLYLEVINSGNEHAIAIVQVLTKKK
jgi:TPR repeat protein